MKLTKDNMKQEEIELINSAWDVIESCHMHNVANMSVYLGLLTHAEKVHMVSCYSTENRLDGNELYHQFSLFILAMYDEL